MLCCGKSKKSKDLKKLNKISNASTVPVSQKLSPKGSIAQSQKVAWGDRKNIAEELNVLKTIFTYLPTNDLLKARLVNKIWNKHACEVLREKLEGVIILQRGLEYYTKAMSKSLDIPVGRIFLNILDMDEAHAQNFFRSIGHSIRHLILNLEGHSVPQFQSHLQYLRNLKQLSLNLFNEHKEESPAEHIRRKTGATPEVRIFIDDYDDANNNKLATTNEGFHLPNLESIIVSCEPNWKTNEPFLVEQLIKASPNLKNINLQKWPFPLKRDLMQRATLHQLSFLTVGYLEDEELRRLAARKFPLKSIDFRLDYDVDAEAFDMFLESVSSTLEYIRIESNSNKNLVFRMQTKAPRLLIIRLTHWVGGIWLDTIAGNCENLVRLQLSNCDPGSISLKHPKSNSNVKGLAVNFGHFSTVSPKIRSEVVKNFIYAFPELESFMMRQVSDKTLGQILDGWPKLKTLKVTSAFGLTDSGLTGIPIAELSKMTKLEYKLPCGCCLPVPVVDDKPMVDNVRIFPHVAKLQNLVDFSIESEEGSHFPLTNFSLHLGLHELTKLNSLKLTCHNELGPHWCLKCIADNLPNLKELTVMDRAISHDRYEEHEVLYLLRKLPKLKLNLTPTNVDHSHSRKLF
ncbi:unnamed protein product [Orchesella dallaii]|uniref:F-box domain-containing protein n=1 Tax=Orchesella dallaii TaxID=48710 RepID=A0ABP1Q4V5_9HEXA